MAESDATRERLRTALDPVRDHLGGRPTLSDDVDDLIPETLAPAAVLVPLLTMGDDWTVLLTRRTAHLKHHAGQVAFPGGRAERSDATLTATALREAREEVGLPEQAVDVIGSLAPLPTITGFQVLPIVGLVQEPIEWRLDPQEVDEVFEVPLSYALDPANREHQSAMYRGRRRRFHVIRYRRHTIWGATAAMLVDLAARWSRAI